MQILYHHDIYIFHNHGSQSMIYIYIYCTGVTAELTTGLEEMARSTLSLRSAPSILHQQDQWKQVHSAPSPPYRARAAKAYSGVGGAKGKKKTEKKVFIIGKEREKMGKRWKNWQNIVQCLTYNRRTLIYLTIVHFNQV